MVVLDLPMPPSVNAATVVGKSRKTGKAVVFSSAEKRRFFSDAHRFYLSQRHALTPVVGPFTYHIVLNEKLRHGNADGDNRQKYVLDFLQQAGVIQNDKLAEGGSWAWGSCEHGCRVSIRPFLSQPREDNHGTAAA